jgi:hypothetical protein
MGKLLYNPNIATTFNLRDIADFIFLHTLALVIIRSEPTTQGLAIAYAWDIVRITDWSQFRYSNCDLYNLFNILDGKEHYWQTLKDKKSNELLKRRIKLDPYIIRTYFRDVSKNQYNTNWDRRFLLQLESMLCIDNSNYKSIRKLVSDWRDLPVDAKKSTMTRLMQAFNIRIRRSDLYPILDGIAKSNDLLWRGVKNPEKNMVDKYGSISGERHLNQQAHDRMKLLGMKESTTQSNSIIVNGVKRPITNSTGNLIANTKEKIENFWKWFGNSRVVDEQGRPLVVYHGTSASFNELDLNMSNNQFWFTTDYSAINNGTTGASSSGNVMQLYVKIDNPADWDVYDSLTLDEMDRDGYDGALLSERDGTITGFVNQRANQIKSVFNKGSFNTSNNLNEDASCDSTSSGDIATIIAPLFSKPIRRTKKPSRLKQIYGKKSSNYMNTVRE